MVYVSAALTLVVSAAALSLTKKREPKQLYVWSDDGPVPYSSRYETALRLTDATVVPSHRLQRNKSLDESLSTDATAVPSHRPQRNNSLDDLLHAEVLHALRSHHEVESLEDGEGDKTASNVLIKPEHKLAFCYFPKVASAEFNGLFNFLNNITQEHLWHGHHFGSSAPVHLGVDMDKIKKERGWKFAIFTRDPLARYLSAFGSKCLPKADGSPGDTRYCAGIVGEDEKDGWPIITVPTDLKTMVAAFERHVRLFKSRLFTKRGKLLTDNKHYMKQSDIAKQCSGDRKIFLPGHVDFIGRLGEDVHRQVKAMLHMVDDKHANNHTEHFFPLKSVAGHQSTVTTYYDQFYRNKKIEKMVYDMYMDDYVTFGKKDRAEAFFYRGVRP